MVKLPINILIVDDERDFVEPFGLVQTLRRIEKRANSSFDLLVFFD